MTGVPSRSFQRSASELLMHPEWSIHRQFLFRMVKNPAFDTVIGVLVVLNLVLVVHETDLIAADEPVPSWLAVVLRVLLGIYMTELASYLFVYRARFFTSKSHLVDLTVVALDLSLEIYGLATQHMRNMPAISVLRIFRVLRLIRIIRAIKLFNELTSMVRGMGGAARTLFWASILLFMLLTMWSLVAVELINPLNVQIALSGQYDDCSRCARAFRSVMDSNLTFVQQILAGDSWGRVSVPIMEAHPWTTPIFLGALLSVQLIAMNIVLAVIVDQAVKARDNDIELKLQAKERERQRASRELLSICKQIDENDNGLLTFEELLKGYDENLDFQDALKTMDVTRDEIQTVCNILDADHSGDVSYNEFVEQLHQMRQQDSHTLLVFVRHHIRELHRQAEAHRTLLEHVSVRLQQLDERQHCDLSGFPHTDRCDESNSYFSYRGLGHSNLCKEEVNNDANISKIEPGNISMAHDVACVAHVHDNTTAVNSEFRDSITQLAKPSQIVENGGYLSDPILRRFDEEMTYLLQSITRNAEQTLSGHLTRIAKLAAPSSHACSSQTPSSLGLSAQSQRPTRDASSPQESAFTRNLKGIQKTLQGSDKQLDLL